MKTGVQGKNVILPIPVQSAATLACGRPRCPSVEGVQAAPSQIRPRIQVIAHRGGKTGTGLATPDALSYSDQWSRKDRA